MVCDDVSREEENKIQNKNWFSQTDATYYSKMESNKKPDAFTEKKTLVNLS